MDYHQAMSYEVSLSLVNGIFYPILNRTYHYINNVELTAATMLSLPGSHICTSIIL